MQIKPIIHILQDYHSRDFSLGQQQELQSWTGQRRGSRIAPAGGVFQERAHLSQSGCHKFVSQSIHRRDESIVRSRTRQRISAGNRQEGDTRVAPKDPYFTSETRLPEGS